jgi:hypothetical protein
VPAETGKVMVDVGAEMSTVKVDWASAWLPALSVVWA